YIYPTEVARIFREAGGTGPVLDIGAGTGLLGQALGEIEVDGIDISPEMLERAEAKGIYRRRILADVTQPIDFPDETYAGLVSCGTFTHGHVGPGCLGELLRVARRQAVFALGINMQVLDRAGFGSALARQVAKGRITPVQFRLAPIYGPKATHDHAADEALVAVFRRL
ncbi:MAG TPA: class I SAM-dependent methyltransferase, partial [Paracoccaceae bacterium]|nr:class I SAM-dependent methyltransferase [Paracoccaceae bacterium]